MAKGDLLEAVIGGAADGSAADGARVRALRGLRRSLGSDSGSGSNNHPRISDSGALTKS